MVADFTDREVMLDARSMLVVVIALASLEACVPSSRNDALRSDSGTPTTRTDTGVASDKDLGTRIRQGVA